MSDRDWRLFLKDIGECTEDIIWDVVSVSPYP